MALSIPPIFKPLKGALTRAAELDRDTTREDSKIVAYYCRQYAMERGLQLRGQDNSKETTTFLMNLMNRLETDKSKFSAPLTKEAGKETVTQFAMSIFEKADSDDRTGPPDQATATRFYKGNAMSFYAASIFFDVLSQFGEVDPDIDTKRKYAKWKAADINDALKNHRPVKPGGPNEAEEEAALSAELAALTTPGSDEGAAATPEPPTTGPTPPGSWGSAPYTTPTGPPATFPSPGSSASALINSPPVAPSASPAMPSAPPMASHQPPPSYNQIPQHPGPSAQPPATAPFQGNLPTSAAPEQISDAIEYAHFAIRALEQREVGLGADRLVKALERLRAFRG